MAAVSSTLDLSGMQLHTLSMSDEAPDKPVTVVLLHGQSFTANTWQECGTLQALVAHGVRAVAVDLPGHGATGGSVLPATERGAFLAALLRALGAGGGRQHRWVLVSPSMSGSYALPCIAQHPHVLDAWVAVAPVGLTGWQAPADASQLKVLAIYGSRDPMKADYAHLEDAVPRAQFLLIPDAGHACYLDAPAAFNAELLRFLENEVEA